MKEERWGAIKQDRRRTHTYYGQEKKKKEEFIHLGPIETILFHKFNVSSCEVHMLEGTIKELWGSERTLFVNNGILLRSSLNPA